jgi:hypothetical protein
MRKFLLTSIITFILAIIVSVLISSHKQVKAMETTYTVRGLPEYRVALIGPDLPSFDTLMSVVLGPGSKNLIETYKPASVFIKNEGDKAIVGLKLKWECVKGDGTVVTKELGEDAPGFLMEDGAPNRKSAINSFPTVTRPNSIKYFSFVDPSRTLEPNANASPLSSSPESLTSLNAEFAHYTNVVISIDGIFFEDGTFVGPNTTGYFEQVKAMVDARRDISREVEIGLESGKSTDEILEPMEALAKSRRVELSEQSTPPDYYHYYKQIFAREPLGVKSVFKDENKRKAALVSHVSRMKIAWKGLRKV